MANQTCSKKPLRPYAPPFYPSRINHHHATGPRNCVVPNSKPKDKPSSNEGGITRKSWPLLKSKKIAQVVRTWIKSRHSLVKHFEDMRLCRPSKECLQCIDTNYLEVILVKDLRRFRESLRRVTDGAEAFLILTLFILCLDKVSTDHAKLVPMGKVCTAKETLEKNTAKGTNNMAALESCPKHNMIAYLEKTEGNVEFHEVIDFLRRSYIYHALTVSPVVSTTFVEQFWTSAKSKTINKERHITAKSSWQGKHFSGKVTPLFDTMLVQPTQDEGASSERLSDEQPSPSPAPTSAAPNESLPNSFSAQPSEVPYEQQPDHSPSPSPKPSPTPSPTSIVPDSIPEPSGENLGDHSSNDTSLSGNEDDMTLQNVYDLFISLCQQVSDQAKEIKLLKAKINKLNKQAKLVIKHHKAYLKSVSLHQRFPRKSFSKKHWVHKESVSKQGRKKAKGESSVQKDPLFDVMPEDKIDHMETENAQSEGRTREMVDEEKEFEKVSTDKPKVSTDGSKVSTDEQVEGTEEIFEGTEEQREGTEEQRESTEEKVESTAGQREGTEDQTKEEIATQASQTPTQTPTSMIFGDMESIAHVSINMSKAKAASKEKEKGVEFEGIDPKGTKGRRRLEEADESENDRLIKRMNKKDPPKEGSIRNLKEEVKKRIKKTRRQEVKKARYKEKDKSKKRRFKQDTSQDDLSDIEKENDEREIYGSIQMTKMSFSNSQQEWENSPLEAAYFLRQNWESEEESTMALELIRFIKKGYQLTLLLGEELASNKMLLSSWKDVAKIAEKTRMLLKKDRVYKIKK
ncbi:hypothetical protein Tco_0751043 [Tanacetum coccineum]|uniref:Uncharacterized protein n=1 Tax=Tanacetum coccineum TaxID=301880 RepID=A0ABQ4Z5Q1_9ASTR